MTMSYLQGACLLVQTEKMMGYRWRRQLTWSRSSHLTSHANEWCLCLCNCVARASAVIRLWNVGSHGSISISISGIGWCNTPDSCRYICREEVSESQTHSFHVDTKGVGQDGSCMVRMSMHRVKKPGMVRQTKTPESLYVQRSSTGNLRVARANMKWRSEHARDKE